MELVVLIGTGDRVIPREHALDHVAGYSIINEGIGVMRNPVVAEG